MFRDYVFYVSTRRVCNRHILQSLIFSKEEESSEKFTISSGNEAEQTKYVIALHVGTSISGKKNLFTREGNKSRSLI